MAAPKPRIFNNGLKVATLEGLLCAVVTVIGPLRASNGTFATIDVAVFDTITAAPALLVKCTIGEPPKPVPLIVTFAPPAAALGVNVVTFPSTENGFAVMVVPPAFLTEIGPSTAAAGTVTFNDVPPTPIENGAVTVPLNFTDDVPENVLPVKMTCVPAAASFGAGSPSIVGRTFNVAGLVEVPFAFVADTEAVRPLSGTTNWKLVSVTNPTVSTSEPSFAVGANPVARKFEPFTVTVSPA